MTRRQIVAKMKKFDVTGEVTGAGKVWEVELPDEKTMKKFCACIIAVGGYSTGYGSWILSPGYMDKGNWNDKSSQWHY